MKNLLWWILTPSIIFGTTLGRHYPGEEMTTLGFVSIVSVLGFCDHSPMSAMGYSSVQERANASPCFLTWQGPPPHPLHLQACKALSHAPASRFPCSDLSATMPGLRVPSTPATLAPLLGAEYARPVPSPPHIHLAGLLC